MIDSIILVIGNLILPYLVLSLFAMLVVELISQGLHLRARNLEYCICNMLSDPDCQGLAGEVYGHPLIKSLSPGGYKPSYIPSRFFALALVDEIEKKAVTSNFEEAIKLLPGKDLQNGLRALFRQNHSGQEVHILQSWFREVMNQASGLYRRRTLVILAVVAVGMVVLLNFDTIAISNYTTQRSVVEKVLEAQAEAMVEAKPATLDKTNLDSRRQVVSKFKPLAFPIGWSGSEFGSVSQSFLKIIGLLASALAVMLGAPLLFDVLNKFMVVRFTVKPFEMTSDEVEEPNAK